MSEEILQEWGEIEPTPEQVRQQELVDIAMGRKPASSENEKQEALKFYKEKSAEVDAYFEELSEIQFIEDDDERDKAWEEFDKKYE